MFIFQKDPNSLDVKNKFFKKEQKSLISIIYWDHWSIQILYFYLKISNKDLIKSL